MSHYPSNNINPGSSLFSSLYIYKHISDWKKNSDETYSCPTDNVSYHHGSLMESPIKPLGPSLQYYIEGLRGASIGSQVCRETLVSRTADVYFQSAAFIYIKYTWHILNPCTVYMDLDMSSIFYIYIFKCVWLKINIQTGQETVYCTLYSQRNRFLFLVRSVLSTTILRATVREAWA